MTDRDLTGNTTNPRTYPSASLDPNAYPHASSNPNPYHNTASASTITASTAPAATYYSTATRVGTDSTSLTTSVNPQYAAQQPQYAAPHSQYAAQNLQYGPQSLQYGTQLPQQATQSPQHPRYLVQNLRERYIRIRVLENYINARLGEFGENWSRTTIHDHHCIKVLRCLTQNEILDLQKESYPGYYDPGTVWDE